MAISPPPLFESLTNFPGNGKLCVRDTRNVATIFPCDFGELATKLIVTAPFTLNRIGVFTTCKCTRFKALYF